MADLLQAFIDFLTNLFAALGEFIGGDFAISGTLGDIADLLSTTESAE